MKTGFPFTAIHQFFFFFKFRCFDLSNLFIYFPYARDLRNRDFSVFLFFSNIAGVDAAEWLESAEEANKRTVVDRSSYARPSSSLTGRKHGRNGGKNGGDKNGKNGESPDRKKGKGSNPRCPQTEGTGSKCPTRAQPTDPGYVYIIEMKGSDGGIVPPPLVKVGYAGDPEERRKRLMAGNPFRLEISIRFKVCNKKAAEDLVKKAPTAQTYKFTVTGGGTEWYKLPSGGLAAFAQIVECVIDEYLDVNNGGGSSSRGGGSSSRGGGSSSRGRGRGRGGYDFLSSPINPCLAPNQEGAVIPPSNNGHFNPPFPNIGNTKWRQSLKGNVLQIKFNCK